MKNKGIPKVYNNIINYLEYNNNYTKNKDTYIVLKKDIYKIIVTYKIFIYNPRILNISFKN